jgi:hypothetical protein
LSRALALALLLWSGTSASQTGMAVTPARTEAAGYAVTHGLVVKNLVAQCRRFRERLQVAPDAALAGWRQRNAERAAAAEAYFVYAAAAIERQEGAAAAESFNRRTHGLFRRKANDTLNDIFERTAPQPWVCEKWIDAIVQGKTDLDWESKYLNTLDELVAFERSLRPGAGK